MPTAHMEADFSGIGNFIYTKLSAHGETPFGVLATDIDVKSESFSGLFGMAYAVLDSPQGHLDLVGGSRCGRSKPRFRSAAVSRAGSREDSAIWVGGIVGLHGRYPLTPEIYLTGGEIWSAAAEPTSTGMSHLHRLRIQRANIGDRFLSCARDRLQRRRFHSRCRPARTHSRGRYKV
ncbi:hypothetical protein BMJ34_01085 [Sinorhizobium medicae]|uniref:Porin n=1 Tax=Sinorhizobium medicae TaxID=110321 RepID=A0ABX4TSH0_9HYPH|nr:hypothetical protein BMJ33_06310 [Sinorhizobium medicae]PLU08825.1 hypothetical protein BMJ34_01085 [Sinorhizobium medicae]PLU18291.1 hypothetical protein BMJ29_18915 [Sinorhizobium medicae]PLU24460.1 hypothetical protein BMJ30_00640 [Sinorhizobium medicae]PLU40297.1 hypothetical protein BMJ27_02195 [Sinorhizobium medicae]